MNTRLLTREEKISWLRLARTDRVGPVAFSRLLSLFGNPETALKHLSQMAVNGGGKKIVPYSKEKAEQEFFAGEDKGAVLLAKCDPLYPDTLRHVKDSPSVIWALGRTSLLENRFFGIVGSRNASLNGRNFTRKISAQINEAGYTVVSGMAIGIDRAAHEGSLDAPNGTIAVLGCGVDVVYPYENHDLYEQIVQKGVIISEYPLQTQAKNTYFPQRNRIISGISEGLLVVEAGEKSGSLITADFARKQKKKIFAVPSSPLDERAGGCNRLIQNGAVLVQDVQDILRWMNPKEDKLLLKESTKEIPIPPLDEYVGPKLETARQIVLRNLSVIPTDMDRLITDLHLPPNEVNAVLAELELAGRLEYHYPNRVSLVK